MTGVVIFGVFKMNLIDALLVEGKFDLVFVQTIFVVVCGDSAIEEIHMASCVGDEDHDQGEVKQKQRKGDTTVSIHVSSNLG